MTRRPIKPTIVSRKRAAQPTSEADRFKPMSRPPVALIEILDDGEETGECFRMRNDTLLIGRSSGDITIPHDTSISSKHFEIRRKKHAKGYRWHLVDVGSRNGSFVRVKKIRVRSNFELTLGSFRYRLVLPNVQGEEEEDAGTRGWAAVTASQIKAMQPQLVQLDGENEVASFPLQSGTSIGSVGADVEVQDPLLNPVHARFVEANSMWRVQDLDSMNGSWIRIEHSVTSKDCEFQLGEQRFRLSVPQ